MDEMERAIREKAMEIVEQHENRQVGNAVDAFKKQLDFKLDQTKSYEEQAKDLIGVKATEKAIQDEDLTKGVTDRKKAEILNHADAHLKQEEAENKKADISLQEANYGVYEGVATYAGIKKPLPQKMQNILFSILSAFQTLLLIAFGLPISAINIIADGVDSVVKKLGTLTKSARWIVLVGILVGIGWVFFLIIKYFLVKTGIIL
jgi:Fe2+ transport system protein B